MKFVRTCSLVLGLLTGGVLAVGILRFSAADQPETLVREPDPCQGQTDEECNQTIDRLRSEGDARTVKWIKDFIASGQDPRTLPQRFTTALPAPPLPTLDRAVENADVIVVGEVIGIEFEVVDDPSGPATVWGTAQMGVESTLKGDEGRELMIRQSGGPWPDTDMKPVLAFSEATPYLLKGDRVVLFLRKDETGYYVQGWTGTYLVDKEDRLDAVTGNPFEASVEAKTLSEFSAQIESLVAVQAGAAR